MNELERNADSVNFLLTKLCQSIAHSHGLLEPTIEKLKLHSFEILLRKRLPREENGSVSPCALDVQIFSAKMIASKRQFKDKEEFGKFEAELDTILQDPNFTTNDTCVRVLQFLLALQGNISNNEEEKTSTVRELLVPGPFTLHDTYNKNGKYPVAKNEFLLNVGPKFFKGIESIKAANNPYMPKFARKVGQRDKTEDNSQERLATAKCSFTDMTARLCGSTKANPTLDSGPFNIFTRFVNNNLPALEAKKIIADEPQAPKPVTIQPVPTQMEERVRLLNWESLGYYDTPKPLPFASEGNVILELMSYRNSQLNKKFEANILSPEQFLTDLKYLTVGIQSDTFKCDALVEFHMIPNVTVSGILPITIQNYVVDFLECGTCYKRLMTMIMKRDYHLMFEGFIFKALCNAINEYLLTMRQFVFGYKDSYLMGYFKRVKKMMKQTVNLSITLGIHPSVQDNVQPPLGSQFLGYIYREIVRLTDMDFIILLVYILRRCCHVYFKHLQKWIFFGVLDDPSNELFICFVDHYRQYTKYHYDKAYFLMNECVPGFLKNFENQILKCGKYTMLLKACKPNHPLFDLDCPSISVCVTFDEIKKLEEECVKYYHRALEVCGKPLTIQALFESRLERKKNFLDMVSHKWRDNMERWSEEQRKIAEELSERKKQRLEVLSQQLQDVKARKVAERRANVENELRHLREMEKLEDKRLLVDNINLRKRIEYYQEMSNTLKEDANEPIDKLTEMHALRLDLSTADQSEETEEHPKNITPHSPCSNIETDFESCIGDEDGASSEYLDCMSARAFDNNGTIFPKLYERSQSHSSNTLETVAKAREAIGDADFQTSTLPGTLNRSASDVINSNEETMAIGPAVTHSASVAIMNAKQEAQRNKMKVMAHEYGLLRDDIRTKSMPDINLNTLPDKPLTDLQRNRRRMMQDNRLLSELDQPAERSQLKLELDTDLVRNRRKVLESEFHILSGERTTPTQAEAPDTPMSTTSDTPLTESAQTEEATAALDEENGNFLEKPSTANETSNANADLPIVCDVVETKSENLKLDVEVAMNADNNKESVLNTALTDQQPTPDNALNTAGLMAKHGFQFAKVNESRLQSDLEFSSDVKPDRNLNLDSTERCETVSDPYSRCMELLKTDFNCPPQNPYIKMNKAITSCTAENSNAFLEAIESRDKRGPLNSISVITLTEFLQKSVTIPMHTHLELVNNEVMRMFLDDLNILNHLRSLRKYFLLMDGEFGAIICDGIIGQLEAGEAPQKLLNYQMLHSILDAALGSSKAGHDKNAENLSFIVSDVPEKFDLTSPSVLDVLSLSYSTEWPLSLILNPETLAQYAKIFRYLMQVRRISWVLERAYQLLKESVKLNGCEILKSPQYRHIQLIRHKFYHFVHVLSNYITATALEASWKQFKDDLLSAICIEDIYRKHTAYIKRIMFLCMLNRKSVEFFNNIDNIFKISLRFYNNLKSRQFKQKKGEEHFTHARYEKLVADETDLDKCIKFTIYLGNKIVSHGYQEEIGEFIHLINFNQYYTAKCEATPS